MREDNKEILYNGFWMLFDKVFVLLLNLFVTVKVANHYGANIYGTYQWAVSVVALFELLVTFVDGRVVKKCYLHYNPESVVQTATVSRLIFAIFALVIGFIYTLFSSHGEDYNLIFIILLCNAIVLNLKFGLENRFEYDLCSKYVVLSSNISMVIGAIFQIIAVHREFSITVIALIAVFTSITNVLIIFFQYHIVYKNDTHKKNFDLSILKSIIKESLPLAVATSCAVIYSRCDSIMIGNMLTTSDVGIYGIAVKLISVVQIAIAPIIQSVYPRLLRLYKTNKSKYIRWYIQITSLMTWIFIAGAILSLFILPFCFVFLNAEYQQAYKVYQIYLIGCFFMYNAGLRAGHLSMIGKGSIMLITQSISAFLNVCLNVIGIRFLGIYGAAIATVVTQILSLWVLNLFFEEGRQIMIWQLYAINPKHMINLIKGEKYESSSDCSNET